MNELYYCPFCKKKLFEGKKELYETLVEHVTDPNGEMGDPGPRITYRCSCVFSAGCFQGYDGGFYYWGKESKGQREVFSKVRTSSAIGSICHYVDMEMWREKHKKYVDKPVRRCQIKDEMDGEMLKEMKEKK